MKVISDISLKDFKFWESAQDTANELTDEQFDMVEQAIEELHPDGIDEVDLNDIFRFDCDWVFETAGIWPKYFKVIAECGLAEYVKVCDTDDMDTLESAGVDFEEVSEYEVDELADLDRDELKDFYHTHFFSVTSKINHNQMVVRCNGNMETEDFRDSPFKYGKIEEINSVPEDGIEEAEDWLDLDDYISPSPAESFVYDEDEMYGKYLIPVWAVKPICKLILDPNDKYGHYEMPESDALNYADELDDENIALIENFVKNLNDEIPNGFIIDWDDEEVRSPLYGYKPEFGHGEKCVTLRVYEK